MADRVVSLVEVFLISFCEEAKACGLGLVVDVVEDGVYILGHILVEVTSLSTYM